MSATLDHAGIARLIPHSGTMCVLDRLVAWTDEEIHCAMTSHVRPDNPLRTARGLLASNAIEYAAQAMALHGALRAGPDANPLPGFLASARSVRMAVLRLDDIPGELLVHAVRMAGDGHQALYWFSLCNAQGRALVEGRAAVVLDTPLSATPTVSAP
jgi:predicted hotdog family 3-hydroxylacyl-ACP dehydratase